MNALTLLLKKQGFTSRSERIRHINVAQRSYEEAQWVAIDMLLHPDLYSHVTVLEKEHMDHDEAYTTSLTLEDITRVASLPEALNEALPFLRSSTEVHAHYLLCKFTYERDESVLAAEDGKVEVSEVEVRSWEERRERSRYLREHSRNEEEEEWANYDYILQRDLWKGRDKVLPSEAHTPCGIRRSKILEIMSDHRYIDVEKRESLVLTSG